VSTRARAGAICLLAALCACGDGTPVPAPAAQPPAGRWYAGDFHVHSSVGSNDTRYPDGSVQSFPEVIRRTAIERGMSFVVITDHSNSAGGRVDSTVEDGRLWNHGPEFPLWEVAAQLSSGDFLFIDGSELSPVSTLAPDQCENCPTIGTGRLTPVGHVACVPERLDAFDRGGAFVDRPPGAVPGGSGIDQCHARNGFAIVNHAFYRPTPWIEYDWTSFEYDAIEVWNGSAGFTSYDRYAYDAYLCDRLQGRTVVAVGGSDNHRTPVPYDDDVTLPLGAPLGLPMTSVFADRLEWNAIMRAVRDGRVVIHELGTFVEFQTFTGDGAYLAGVGDTIAVPPAGNVTVRLRGRSPRPQALRFVHVAPGGCNDRRQPSGDAFPAVSHEVVLAEEVCRTAACEFDRSLVLSLQVGLYYATVGDFAVPGLNLRDVAVTNVMTVSAAS
jgi:hypothetical protein